MQPDQATDYIAGILVRNQTRFSTRDDGRGYRVVYGSTAVFINVSPWGEDDTVVSLAATAVEQLGETKRQEVLERINKLNCDCYIGKFCLYGTAVRVEHDLLASHLQPPEFMGLLMAVASHAEQIGSELRAELGGKSWAQAEQEANRQADALDT
jgi:hypothetical protein